MFHLNVQFYYDKKFQTGPLSGNKKKMNIERKYEYQSKDGSGVKFLAIPYKHNE